MLILATPPGPAGAGAWTQPRGAWYTKIEGAWLSADQQFDETGDKVDYVSGLSPATYDSRQVRFYGEYGLAERWTLVGSLAWQDLVVEETAARWHTWGLSDLRVGGRWALTRGPWVTALATELKAPTGYDETEFPALGSGRADLSFSAQAGRSFGRVYATADAGYNIRGGPLADELFGSAELGWNPVRRWQLRGVVRGRRSLEGADQSGSFDPLNTDSRSLDLAGALSWAAATRIQFEAGATSTLAGRRTLAGTEYSLALVWHR